MNKPHKEQWEAIVSVHQYSGLTAKAYCQEQDVGLASFYAWRKRLRTIARKPHFWEGNYLN